MTTTTDATAPLSFSFDDHAARDIAEFDTRFETDGFAARVAGRMTARGLEVCWTDGGAKFWRKSDAKVGVAIRDAKRFGDKTALVKHDEYTAQIDLMGLSADGVEVIVRVRLTRYGRGGKLRPDVFVGAYIGDGGVDAFGRKVEPRFLHDSRNAPQVKVARALLGLS